MRAFARLLCGTLAGAVWVSAVAQAPGAGGEAAGRVAPQPRASAADARESVPDTAGTGPFAAIRTTEASLPEHVVYRPRDLAGVPAGKLGVVVWGNGGCSDDGASARLHLEEIASHGYVVIAPGRILSGPGAPARPAVPTAPGPLGIRTTTAQVAAGIDWALAENKRRGSPYYGKIDPQMIASSGHSCGGLQALQLGADPRVRAVVIHNSGVFKDGSNPIRGITVDKSALMALHTPVVYILGGPGDIAFPNGSDDFEKINHVPVALVSAPVGHGGTFMEPNGGRAAQIAAAWLDWQLRGDAMAGRMFKGADCGLCSGSPWTIQKKRID